MAHLVLPATGMWVDGQEHRPSTHSAPPSQWIDLRQPSSSMFPAANMTSLTAAVPHQLCNSSADVIDSAVIVQQPSALSVFYIYRRKANVAAWRNFWETNFTTHTISKTFFWYQTLITQIEDSQVTYKRVDCSCDSRCGNYAAEWDEWTNVWMFLAFRHHDCTSTCVNTQSAKLILQHPYIHWPSVCQSSVWTNANIDKILTTR